MKNGKKTYLLMEAILGILVMALALMMFRERETGERYRVSVVIPNSEDNQWAAFKYGLKMAAEDQGIELSVVSTGTIGSEEEERELIEEETALGADGLILLAVPEEIRKKFSRGRRSRSYLPASRWKKKMAVSPVWSRIIMRWESRWGKNS